MSGTCRIRSSVRPRGFSLLEALVSAALLSMIVIACMPLLRSAAAGAAKDQSAINSSDRLLLTTLADSIAAKPALFGIGIDTTGSIEIAWPEDVLALRSNPKGSLPVVTVEVLVPASHANARRSVESTTAVEGEDEDDEAMRERWLSISTGGERLCRWCLLPRVSSREQSPRRRLLRTSRSRSRLLLPAPRLPLVRGSAAGMTLIETLVALAITSALTAAVFTWTSAATRVAQAASARASRDATTASLLRGLADDLVCRDVELGASARARERVKIENGSLAIKTRAGSPGFRGPVLRRYVFNSSAQELFVEDLSFAGETERATLARGINRWEVSLNEKGTELTVTLALDGGESVTRGFLGP